MKKVSDSRSKVRSAMKPTLDQSGSLAIKRACRILVAICISLLGFFVSAQEQIARPVALHVLLARDLQENVPASHNSYQHAERISLPSDAPTQPYTMYADCSGLAIALLDRAQSLARQRMQFLKGHKRPYAEDFVRSIQQAKGFTRIFSVGNIQPGDIIAWEFQFEGDKKIAKDTGHVMIIDSLPTLIVSRPPVIPETTQLELSVIDSSRNYHDPMDTRVQPDGTKIHGIGRGSIRLYVSTEGEIVGFANNFKSAMFQPFNPQWSQYSTGKSKIGAIGRPDYL